MRREFFAVTVTFFFIITLSSCAVLSGTRSISAADNYLKKKQYSNAVAAYREFLQEAPDSFYAADARYGLAMTLVAADNAQKDYAQATHEFEIFVKLYPNDKRSSEAQNWVAVLKALNDQNKRIEQLKRLDIRHEERRRKN